MIEALPFTPPPGGPQVFAGSAAYARAAACGGPCRPVLTIGNFDGVHLGHRRLLSRLVDAARARGRPAAVFTFDPPPRTVLAPSQAAPRVTAWPDRVRLLGDAGVDQVIVERFSRAFAQHPPAWFADEVLGRRLGAVEMVVGWDFRFGKARAGTVDTLRERLQIPVEQVDALHLDGAVASSSRVRQCILDGDVEGAAQLLGRPHFMRGVVVPGDRRGRRLGFPTANVEGDGTLLPAAGVYAVRAIVDGGPPRAAVANLGVRPTFGGDGPSLVEVHLLDFSGDLYGAEVEVSFVARLRGERRFPDADALAAQIQADVAEARARLGAPA